MTLPKTISSWCLILYFLIVGLGAFVPLFVGGFWPFILGLLALGFVVFSLLGK
jgi:hypothetical protein